MSSTESKIFQRFSADSFLIKACKISWRINPRSAIATEEENLWLELYKDDTIKYFTYDIFSPEGIYLKQVRIDQRIFQFKNGKIYSIVRPEDGYPSIKRFLMELVAE